MNKINFSYYQLLLLSTILSSLVITSGTPNQSETAESKSVAEPNHTIVLSDNSQNGRSIRDSSSNTLDKSKRPDSSNRDSLRKEKDMYDIMRLHQMSANSEYSKEVKAEQEKKEQKGKLQTVGGVVGEIIAVIVSEVVKLFGNMVSDVAREVTAHGFVSIFKQFTDLTGISIPENII